MHRAAIVEEHELDRWIGVLIRYAEPALIIAFGGFIGFVALALLQAVYGIQGGVMS
jgi:type II secretory pathway component PulF